MKRNFERLVVVTQIETAEKCSETTGLPIEIDSYNFSNNYISVLEKESCPVEILTNDAYMELKNKKN
jgi:hypothetical protein